TRDAPAAKNVPGARQAPLAWTDAAHNFWLFGGIGYDGDGRLGNLNDLWKYSPTTGEWVWVSGSAHANQRGHYGTRNIAAGTNVPGARYLSVAWTDEAGNLWLFGGARARPGGKFKCFSDMWKYSPDSGDWTWVAGPDKTDRSGHYGKRQTPGAANFPGARQAASVWARANGSLWLFGGYGKDSAGNLGDLNGLWRYHAR
ncbi:MAG TPA: kelch repeat-containing protein, partial [Gammaproteobacteria bacterium]|nr:kelch repeat-containing protein [Gammaproteobacteria bacterium]